MIDDWREVIRWAILMLFVLIFAYVFDGLALPVFTWLGQVIDQMVGIVARPALAELAGEAFSHLGMTSIHFAAGGFAYSWLVYVPWKRGAAMAWLCFMILRYAAVMHIALGSPWFYADAALGLVAAYIGAHLYEEYRYNEHIVGLRRRLHDRLQLA